MVLSILFMRVKSVFIYKTIGIPKSKKSGGIRY
jgi:hypothetical protein